MVRKTIGQTLEPGCFCLNRFDPFEPFWPPGAFFVSAFSIHSSGLKLVLILVRKPYFFAIGRIDNTCNMSRTT